MTYLILKKILNMMIPFSWFVSDNRNYLVINLMLFKYQTVWWEMFMLLLAVLDHWYPKTMKIPLWTDRETNYNAPKNMLQQTFLLAGPQKFNIYNTDSLFQSSQVILLQSSQCNKSTDQLQTIISHHQCQSSHTHKCQKLGH